MTANRRLLAVLVAIAASSLLQVARADAPALSPAQRDAARHDAGELGCTVCHRVSRTPRAESEAPPLAPSFDEIAARYRGKPGAEQRLTGVVTDGEPPGERHWKDRLDFTSMGANAPRVSRARARALVRWILSPP